MSSPEQLDQTVKVLKPSGWITLASIGLLFAIFLWWGITGSIPDKAAGTGVLINSGQIISIKYPSYGMIKNVFVSAGNEVQKGQIIARIERQDMLDQIQATSIKVDDLQQTYLETAGYSKQSTGLTSKLLNKSASDLNNQLATLREQLAQNQEKEKKMMLLLTDGLITEQQYIAARNETFSVQQHIHDIESKLIDVDVSKVKTSGESKQQLMSLQQQINEARKQLETLQNNYLNSTKIVSNVSGTIIEVLVQKGDFINTGSTIVTVEPYVSDGSMLQAFVYFPDQDGKKIKRGMNISICPSTVKQEEFGFIKGIVTSVSQYPISDQYLMTRFQNKSLASAIAQIATPVEVRVSLIPDPATKSGYKWSSSKGPDIRIETGIMCSGSVTTSEQRPINLLIPVIKKRVFGIGE